MARYDRLVLLLPGRGHRGIIHRHQVRLHRGFLAEDGNALLYRTCQGAVIDGTVCGVGHEPLVFFLDLVEDRNHLVPLALNLLVYRRLRLFFLEWNHLFVVFVLASLLLIGVGCYGDVGGGFFGLFL